MNKLKKVELKDVTMEEYEYYDLIEFLRDSLVENFPEELTDIVVMCVLDDNNAFIFDTNVDKYATIDESYKIEGVNLDNFRERFLVISNGNIIGELEFDNSDAFTIINDNFEDQI